MMADHLAGIEQIYLALTQLFAVYIGALAALQIPTPVGVLGLWRWGIWLFRRLIGLCYRPHPVSGFTLTTSVVTPVYNEVPHVFEAALRSWAANRPTEIIAIIDHSDQKSVEVFQALEKEWAAVGIKAKMVITPTPGKRPALVDGMLEASGEVICLVDSDTIWAPDVLVNVLAPFEDPEVGGVTTRQNVLAPNSLAQRIFDVYLDIRYEDEVRFLTALKDTPFGDAVTCLSGRTAVYRRTAVLPVLEGLLRERFLGQRVISGDDKALTLLVQSQRWKIRYQETARVFTPGATEMRTFLKQRLRWARNSWRADLKAVGSSWAWRKPLLAFHLIDRLLQPLTTIVAPIFVTFAIVRQHWLAVFVVVTWWFVSRSVKLWPHIKRDWRNISILPTYVFFTYWSAVMRIYAFFTMNQQGWITRWNQNRMALLGPLRVLPAYLGTTLTIALVALGIFFKGLSADSVARPINIAALPAAAVPKDDQVPVNSVTFPTPTPPASLFNTSGELEQAPVDWTPLFSPDREQIVFVAVEAQAIQLFIRDAASGRLREVLPTVEAKSWPIWSLDSRKLAVFVGQPEQLVMQTLDIHTHTVRRWQADQLQTVLAEFGDWSPALLARYIKGAVATKTDAVLAQPVLLEFPYRSSMAALRTGLDPNPGAVVPLASTASPTPEPTATPTVMPTHTPLPTATPSPTATALPPAPTFVGTPAFYLLAVVPNDHPVNIRYSADQSAPVLAILKPGSVISAVSRTADNRWLQVILPDQRLGWVSTEVVVIDWGYIDNLPQIAPPAL